MREAIPRVLAIHDLCAFGRCSLTAVLPVLSARGVQCCPLPAALLSTPTNYRGGTMRDLSGEMPGILSHLREAGAGFDAIYSGFLANPAQAALVGEAYGAFPGALRVVDPVLGDNGRLYRTMDGEMAGAVRRLAEGARVITPNVTEAAILLGKPADSAPSDRDELAQWLDELSLSGSRSVALTGLSFDPETIAVGWTEGGASGLYCHPRAGGDYPGTGDLFASHLLAELLYETPFSQAVEAAACFVGECAALTAARGANPREGLLFEAVLRKRCKA